MSETLDRASEIAKLARLLGVGTEQIDYLDAVPSQAIAQFRAQATDRLFAGDTGRLSRVAAASRMVPVPLTVRIAQLAFGPVLCAATAGLLEPAHAVKVASRVPTPFLADIAVHLDPRRAPDVIAAVPPDIVVRVAVELLRRGEHVAMGRFVNFLPLATLRAAVPCIEDEADLLRVAFVMEGKSSVDDLLDIARGRLQQLIDAAHEHDMWAEALDLIGHLSLENTADLAELGVAQDTAVLDALVRAAHRRHMWDALLPVTAVMSREGLERFAAVPAVVEPDVLDGIVGAALVGSLWLDILPLASALPEDGLRRVAERVAREDDETLARLAEQAHDADRWDAMLPLALAFDDATRGRLAALPLFGRADVVRAALDAAAEHDLWGAVLPLVGDPDHVAAVLTEATPDTVWDALVEAGDRLPAPVRDVVGRRAAELGRDHVVTRLTPGVPGPATTARRPRPGRPSH